MKTLIILALISAPVLADGLSKQELDAIQARTEAGMKFAREQQAKWEAMKPELDKGMKQADEDLKEAQRLYKEWKAGQK